MSEDTGAKRWYAVHTYSGYENKVKTNLEKRVDTMNMQEQIFRVVIPEEEETSIKDGKAKTQIKKTFPGYVLVELIMTDESWYIVRNTPGVTGFVGSAGAGSKPNPLLHDEAKFILKQMGMSEKTVDVEVELGEQVRVTSGPFNNQVGEIKEIDVEKYKLTVLVDMFGRETPVEVEFDQIEKL
ncbi:MULTISPECIES: transcription termination/antitermination protein NusG [Mammaliicoccus]|uniref:Transcription termination/antitermination protein NusG n=1 Tax=Mammaliicoccus fleurettii TaxID=150056 RepID=A0ABS5MP47_9STAP|nr:MULTISPECIES: transcription termination/antitermination protein NusG [Mammaliicoccus]MBL0847845.1 transcription termination/antitermination protein NusG [Mammaliicoccus fleurettii]MBO3063630.1 transcription termination/antitermination protein NusG [Mammaliicoccus fleurettii]MBS3672661.1 transcription termination/antitermination protein NusG [Mammaliicoccus fleurettii]MBS3697647.1 transcription termination/antitermination protein NusG [Mammaliicoccus fleurettii]MBW0765714.1 transcription ter